MVFKGLATQSVLGITPRASPAKAGLNQIMQSLNPLLWHGSWAVSVAGCVILLSSTYLKVSPGASRRDGDSFVLEILHEQLWEMFGRLRCACTEQTSGRRRAEERRTRRSGWLCKGDFASAPDTLTSVSYLISPMLLGRSDAHKHLRRFTVVKLYRAI